MRQQIRFYVEAKHPRTGTRRGPQHGMYDTATEAQAAADELERHGYRTAVHSTEPARRPRRRS